MACVSIAEAQTELLGRCADLERKLLFFKRAWQNSIGNAKNCACMIDPDTEEVISPCEMHSAWRDASVEYALKHQIKNEA